jgi:hypothetical protein
MRQKTFIEQGERVHRQSGTPSCFHCNSNPFSGSIFLAAFAGSRYRLITLPNLSDQPSRSDFGDRRNDPRPVND